ncbi:SBBP repeat-containing protein [candidate division KSB1 bacterium]|nr:SBBP repeat-containing protein [candidate division KSB1 bacterium]
MKTGHNLLTIVLLLFSVATTAQYASSVDTAWVRQYKSDGIPGIDKAVDIAVDRCGNVVVTGYCENHHFGMDFCTIKYDACGEQLWTAKYDNQNENDTASDMCMDESGNVYVTGLSGHGFSTVKYNAAGQEQWISRYENRQEYFYDKPRVAMDSKGNIYAAMVIDVDDTTMCFHLSKYNSCGEENWQARYESRLGALHGIAGLAVDNYDNVFVTGCHYEKGVYNPEPDFITLKYDSTGKLQWAVLFNGSGNHGDIPADLAIDPAGNVYVTGESIFAGGNGSSCATIKYDNNGVLQWTAIHNGTGRGWHFPAALAVDASGNVLVAGTSREEDTYNKFCTIKYDAGGMVQWITHYVDQNDSNQKTIDMAMDKQGNVYVTGENGFEKSCDYTTVAYSAAGAQQWVSHYNGPANVGDHPAAVVADDFGYVYVTGVGDLYHFRGFQYDQSSDIATVKYNACGLEQWAAQYNGPGKKYAATANDIAIDGEGNAFVTGSCPGDSPGGKDYLTMKYDASGTLQWSDRCREGAEATRIVVDGKSYVYVTGYGDVGFTTVKYNPSGVKQWTACGNWDSNGSLPWETVSLAVDASGNVYVAGGVDISNTDADYITIKYDSSGYQQWAVTYDGRGAYRQIAKAIAVDDSGNVFVTGLHSTIKYNSLGIGLWVRGFSGEPNDMAVDHAGNVYITGSTDYSGTGRNFLTTKYDAAGNRLWDARYDGPAIGYDYAYDLALDDSGNVFVTGYSNGEFTTIKYNPAGTAQWIARNNSRMIAQPPLNRIVLDAQGNIFVGGTSYDEEEGENYTVIKYDNSGIEQWIAHYNGPGNSHDHLSALAVNNDGQIHLTGTSSDGDILLCMMTTVKYVEYGCSGSVNQDILPEPQKIVLMQNYPNPFNSNTTFQFVLPCPAFVTLKVCNLLGEHVITLVDELRSAGIHKITWNAAGLASGVYQISLESDSYKQTKEFLLLR